MDTQNPASLIFQRLFSEITVRFLCQNLCRWLYIFLFIFLMKMVVGQNTRSAKTLSWGRTSFLDIAFSPDDAYLAVLNSESEIKIWRTDNYKKYRELKNSGQLAQSIAFTNQKDELLAGGLDGSVVRWSIIGNKIEQIGHAGKVFSNSARMGVLKLTWSDRADQLLTAGVDRSLRIWDGERFRQDEVIVGHNRPLTDVAFLPNGVMAVSASLDRLVKLWDLSEGRMKRVYKGHTAGVKAVDVSQTGHLIASAAENGRLIVWEAQTGRKVFDIQSENQVFETVRFIKNGRFVLVGGGDSMHGIIQVYDLENGKLRMEWREHNALVRAMAIGSDERIMATASEDGSVKIWNLQFLFYEDLFNPNLYVLSIGVNNSGRVGDVPLQFAESDAQKLGSLMRNMQGLLYHKVATRFCLGAKATTKKISEELEWILSEATQNDVVMIYVSSHAEVENEKLVLRMAGEPKHNNRGLRIDDLLYYLELLPCKKIILLDACYSGQVARELQENQNSPEGKLFENAAKSGQYTIMTSSSYLENSWEVDGHGVFTRTILEGLSGAADYDKNKHISLEELNLYATHRLKELSDGMQHNYTPIMHFSDMELFYNQ